MGKSHSICLISPSLQMGGLERAMSNLANYFAAQGHQITYVLLYRFEKFYKLDDRIKLVEPDFDYRSLSKAAYYLKLVPYIRKEVKNAASESVLSFGDYHNAVVLFALRGLSVPVYVSDRSSPNKNFGKLFTLFKKWTYKRSAGVIAQTGRAADQKKKLLGDKCDITVIPNTVRKVNASNVERKHHILGVGRHYHVKGLDRLIEAYGKLNTDWKLVLAGDGGPESGKLRDLVSRLSIEDKVVFLGKVTDMDAVYAESGVFVLTSRSEGFPNALCEAMAAGIPSVSYDIVAGPADIITHNENGLLVPDGDEKGLVNTLQKLIDDEKLRNDLGNKARYIQEELSFERSGDKYLKFITKHLQ